LLHFSRIPGVRIGLDSSYGNTLAGFLLSQFRVFEDESVWWASAAKFQSKNLIRQRLNVKIISKTLGEEDCDALGILLNAQFLSLPRPAHAKQTTATVHPSQSLRTVPISAKALLDTI